MRIFTLGFTKKTAEDFFTALRSAGVRRLIDVRLHNVSQLAGFAKRDDLQYFLRELCDCEYMHEPLLTPTQAMLDQYRTKGRSWDEYEKQFAALMASRKVEQRIDRSLFATPSVLLCSEPTPEHCHRRLILEYLSRKWGSDSISIHHL